MAATQQSVGRFWNENLNRPWTNPFFITWPSRSLIPLVDWRTYLHAYASSLPCQDKQEDSIFVGPKDDPYEQSWPVWSSPVGSFYKFGKGGLLQCKKRLKS